MKLTRHSDRTPDGAEVFPDLSDAGDAVIRVEELPNTFEDPGGEFETVKLSMTAADRVCVRRRLTAPDGVEFALALPTGAKLWPGQILYTAPGKVYAIEAAPEDVLVIQPRDVREAAFVGHLIGHLHREIDLESDGVAALWDETLEERLEGAGLSFERQSRPFHGSAAGEHAH